MDLRVLNLGVGVQSQTMYVMAARGELPETPTCAIFADTGVEPPHVYEALSSLQAEYGDVIPIHVVTNGNLEDNLYWGDQGRSGFAQIPTFLDNPETGKRGIGRRQCTYQFKVRPIEHKCRELLGLKKGQRAKGKYMVEQWIGISVDEAHRAKDSPVAWITRRYPLLFDRPMRRSDCIEYMRKLGRPIPKKSACYFCPFHSNAEWRAIRDEYPELWKRAVKLDADMRGGEMVASEDLKSKQYLHQTLVPLDQADLGDVEGQGDLFGNECEGHCGV